jgi:hypothetical protein
MTDEQTRTSDSGRNFAIAVILACYLIGTFLWSVLIPAHEYQARAVQMLTIGLNLLAVVGLFGLKTSMPKPLFGAALLAEHRAALAAPDQRPRLVDRASILFAVAALIAPGEDFRELGG